MVYHISERGRNMDIKNETQKETRNNRRQDYRKYLSQSATRETMQKDHQRNCTIFLGMFLLATGICFVFNQIASDPSLNIAMVYVLGLFMVARHTDGYLFGLLFAICSVISVNYFFTVPYRNLNFTMEGYQVTFAGMLIIAMITSAMTTHMKEQAAALAEQEKQLMLLLLLTI